MNAFFGLQWFNNLQVPVLYGPTFSVALPNGFFAAQTGPGAFVILPPGSTAPPASPATVILESVPPMFVLPLQQGLYSMDNPMAAMMQGMSMGIGYMQVLGPARQIPFAGGVADIREVEGVSLSSGQPLRLVMTLIQGPTGALKAFMAINLYRWQEFFGHCIEFAGSINVTGQAAPLPPPPVRYELDSTRQQVEVRVAGHSFNSMPVYVQGNLVVNITDQSVTTGDIIGNEGIAVGARSIAQILKKGKKS
jgi:hypothetical protein